MAVSAATGARSGARPRPGVSGSAAAQATPVAAASRRAEPGSCVGRHTAPVASMNERTRATRLARLGVLAAPRRRSGRP